MAVGVQRQEVFEAADALIRAGLRPTIERVRQKLGRGSPNTVSPMLDDWFQTLGPRLSSSGQAPQDAGAPAPTAMAALSAKFWEAALLQARKELSPVQEALELERIELERQRTEMARQAAAHDLRVQQLLDRQQGLEGAVAQLQQQLAHAQEKEGASQALAATLAQEVRLSHAGAQEAREALDALRVAMARETAKLSQQHAAAEKHWALETDRAREAAKLEASQALAQLAKVTAELRSGQAREALGTEALAAARTESHAQAAVIAELKAALASWQGLASARAKATPLAPPAPRPARARASAPLAQSWVAARRRKGAPP